MRLRQFNVQNYKSLRGIRFAPRDLSTIVGANAAGKSNLADCLDFVSEIYRHGLEVAVARKGGFENIAFRRMRRSKGAIDIDLIVDIPAELPRTTKPIEPPVLSYHHRFSFGAKSQSIRADYEVVSESLNILYDDRGTWIQLGSVVRSQGGGLSIAETGPDGLPSDLPAMVKNFYELSDLRFVQTRRKSVLPSSELFVTSLARYAYGVMPFIRAAAGIRVFQISPTRSREFGVPTPRPELDTSGANLPAVVDLLKETNKAQWKKVMDAMRLVLPRLSEITVDYTTNRTLGVFFHEEGVGRPWSVSEVSDGTIQTLALLIAIFDPRYTALVIEEPENSVHPWIIRHLLSACKTAAESKQIIITTHSPVVMNASAPDSIYVIWRHDGESHLSEATTLDSDLMEMWQEGKVATFDYFDSGAIPEAIPPAPDQE